MFVRQAGRVTGSLKSCLVHKNILKNHSSYRDEVGLWEAARGISEVCFILSQHIFEIFSAQIRTFACFFRCICEGSHIFSKISPFTAKLLGNYGSTTLNKHKIILCIKEKYVVMLQR